MNTFRFKSGHFTSVRFSFAFSRVLIVTAIFRESCGALLSFFGLNTAHQIRGYEGLSACEYRSCVS